MAILTNIWNLILPYIYWAIVAFVVLLLFFKFINMIFREMQARWHERWKEKRAKKLEQKAQKQEEKRRRKHSIVKANNWLLNEITRTRIIIFKGLAGKGKTLLMQVFTMFLIMQFEHSDRKNRKYNQIMNPEYIKRRNELQANKLLPVYTNMDDVLHPITKFTAPKTAMDILTQRKKSNSPAVLQLDEIGDTLGKSVWYDAVAEKDKEKIQDNSEIKDFARKLRHYGLWLFGTEQDGDDIWKNIRQFGYTEITAIKTDTFLAPQGKRKQRAQILKNKLLLGYFKSMPKRRFAECLFWQDKVKTALKLFLPACYAAPRQFYLNRNEIWSAIKEKYTIFKTLFQWENKLYWLNFTNQQKLSYNTVGYNKSYHDKFAADGSRKKYL